MADKTVAATARDRAGMVPRCPEAKISAGVNRLAGIDISKMLQSARIFVSGDDSTLLFGQLSVLVAIRLDLVKGLRPRPVRWTGCNPGDLSEATCRNVKWT